MFVGGLITAKWQNIRDSFVKSLKKKSGQSANKKYLYHDNLLFLLKIVQKDDTQSSIDESQDVNELPEEEAETPVDESTSGTIPKITSNPRKKARLQNSIDREILDALNKPPDEDEAFFISITPAVRKMSDEDKLDFKMQVLQVIKNINNKNRYAPPSVPASPIHSNYLYSQQSQQSNSRYNLSPGPSTSHF
jgi:hypothetical protein